MNKPNKKTFADRAKSLITKYSRADFDPTERQELDTALAALAQEQEEYKRVNGIGEYSPENIQAQQMQQMQSQSMQQELPQFNTGGTLYGYYTANGGKYPTLRERAEVAKGFGINNYTGTAAQNSQLLGYLRGGNAPTVQQPAVAQAVPPVTQELPQFIARPNQYLPLNTGIPNSSNGFQPSAFYVDAASPVINSDIQPGFTQSTVPPSTVPRNTVSPVQSVVTTPVGNVTPQSQSITQNVAFPNLTPQNITAPTPAQPVSENTLSRSMLPPGTGQPITVPETLIGRTQGILPSVLAGSASMLGNLGMAMATKPLQFDGRYGTQQISLAKERARLARAANTERNIAMSNLRTAGGRGAYMAGVGQVAGSIGQGLAQGLSDSYTKEGMINLQQREKAAELNRGVDMMNFQNRMQADQDRRAYVANAINSVVEAGTDINHILGQNAMIESLGSINYMVSPYDRNLWKGNIIKGRVRPTK